jgi:hypothetical protein
MNKDMEQPPTCLVPECNLHLWWTHVCYSRAVTVKVCNTTQQQTEVRSQQCTGCEQQLFGSPASKHLEVYTVSPSP